MLDTNMVYFTSPAARKMFGSVKLIGQTIMFATMQVRKTVVASHADVGERLKIDTITGAKISITEQAKNIPM